ncbi:hypothetical protein ASD11_04535 [Aeromicrobium sp. Root495]|uniref:hypothetical protein n=1 Tax=Aeromicrobium sp. Root495 TaxID=1736550 RepID=UPI000700C54A|nr:hypothetical protein [Aeromicrobium sp. Root495]KQY58900.1 hypothetical protein ASD11_04535 [Aeromicrobium sp. Root495]
MKLPETPTEFWRSCRDWKSDYVPPEFALMAMFALTGGVEPIRAQFVEMKVDENVTTWHLVAVTEKSLVEVEVAADSEYWTYDHAFEGTPTITRSRAFPLGQDCAVDVVALTQQGVGFNRSDINWDAQYEINFGGTSVALPKWGRPHNEPARTRIQSVADAVLRPGI